MIDDLHFLPQPIGPQAAPAANPQTLKPLQGPSFQEILGGKLQSPLRLSAHAQQRLSSRQIQLTQQDWDKINQAVDKAAAKGSKDALVVTDKAALVVSVKNRTVVTAVDTQSMKDNVFTNIDSAVIA